MSHTIVALATPSGEGGIAIVRLSGMRAIDIADGLFRGKAKLSQSASHSLLFGRLVLPAMNSSSQGAIDVHDEVLVSVMRAPHSYTREDVVEINCHGGVRLADEVIRACVALGARRAERGEFTERAYLNGRLDLAQAEAVLGMVTARTRDGLAAACYQMNGGLSATLSEVRETLSSSLSRIEAGLEFDDENLGVGNPRDEAPMLSSVLSDIRALLATYSRGRLITDGACVAIIGPPNVGKSSLLNAILGEDRAIVSPVPGTTRDLIESEADIGGIRVRLVDTAGLRETGDAVEQEGARRAERVAAAADLVVLVCDASGAIPSDTSPIIGRMALVALNKMDRARAEVVEEIIGSTREFPSFRVCAVTGEGVEELCSGIHDALCGSAPDPATGGIVTRARHADALAACEVNLERALTEIAAEAREELVAADIRLALDAIGTITGETTPEDIVRKIFAEFCVGK